MLRSNQIVKAMARMEYDVVRLMPTDKPIISIWFGASIDFEQRTQKGSELIAVSLAFFEGQEDDNLKVPLFRVEWDTLERESNHAQPHWHVYSTNINARVHEKRDTFVSEPQVKTFEGPNEQSTILEFGVDEGSTLPNMKQTRLPTKELQKFHFALGSSWHAQNAQTRSHRAMLEHACLADWIVLCVEYVKHQLDYIYHK